MKYCCELRFCSHQAFTHAPLSRVPLCVSWAFLVTYRNGFYSGVLRLAYIAYKWLQFCPELNVKNWCRNEAIGQLI